MGEFSIIHVIFILAIILIFFGPSRLPGLGNSLGKAIRGFKDGIKGLDDEVNEKPAKPAPEQLAQSQKTSETTDKTKENKS